MNETYRRLAIKSGLPLQMVVKDAMMFKVLSTLAAEFKHPLVGGTALNRIYFHKVGRFSEDLDFEVYGKRKIELPKIKGFVLKGPYTYRRNVRFEYGYATGFGKDKIRIDINLKPKVAVRTVKKSIEFIAGIVANVETFSLEGLVARKLLAMTRRTEGKDVYDIFMTRDKVSRDLLVKEIRNLLKIERVNVSVEELLSGVKRRIEECSTKELMKTNPYIPLSNRIDWKLAKNEVLLFLEFLV